MEDAVPLTPQTVPSAVLISTPIELPPLPWPDSRTSPASRDESSIVRS